MKQQPNAGERRREKEGGTMVSAGLARVLYAFSRPRPVGHAPFPTTRDATNTSKNGYRG